MIIHFSIYLIYVMYRLLLFICSYYFSFMFILSCQLIIKNDESDYYGLCRTGWNRNSYANVIWCSKDGENSIKTSLGMTWQKPINRTNSKWLNLFFIPFVMAVYFWIMVYNIKCFYWYIQQLWTIFRTSELACGLCLTIINTYYDLKSWLINSEIILFICK